MPNDDVVNQPRRKLHHVVGFPGVTVEFRISWAPDIDEHHVFHAIEAVASDFRTGTLDQKYFNDIEANDDVC